VIEREEGYGRRLAGSRSGRSHAQQGSATGKGQAVVVELQHLEKPLVMPPVWQRTSSGPLSEGHPIPCSAGQAQRVPPHGLGGQKQMAPVRRASRQLPSR